MVISAALRMHSSMPSLVSLSPNAQRMLMLFGWRVVRSHPATGASPLSPSLSLTSPRYWLMSSRTVLLDAVVPTLPPTSSAPLPIQ